MPAFLSQMAATVGGILVTMAGQLVTEAFLKHLIASALGVLVKRTQTDFDDKLLQDAKQAWNIG